MDYDVRRRISDLADSLLDAGNDPPAVVLDELRQLIGPPSDDAAVERAAMALKAVVTSEPRSTWPDFARAALQAAWTATGEGEASDG